MLAIVTITSLLKQIINGCRKQRRESQKKLYELYYAYGMSITLRYSDTREQAAIVLNDAFMKVFDNIKSYNQEKPFKPWFRRIIINTAINHYHKIKKERILTPFEIHENNLGQKETIISSISYDDIVAMVQKLSPAYRTVFNLHVIEGYTHQEISQMLHIAEGTSKSNLAKAKKNLRVMLEKNLSGMERKNEG